MADSFPIKIWNGILKDGHCQKIGNALWEFIWIIDKVTLEKDGIGHVLKGRPIKVEEMCKSLDRSYQAVYRHLKLLEKYGYINIKKAPYGIIITVNKSKKFKARLIKNDKAGLIKNDKARLIKNDERLIKNDKANKTLKDIKKKKKSRKKKKGLSEKEKILYAQGMNLERSWNGIKEKPEITKKEFKVSEELLEGARLCFREFGSSCSVRVEKGINDQCRACLMGRKELVGKKDFKKSPEVIYQT